MAYEATEVSEFGSEHHVGPTPLQHARGHFWREEEDQLIRDLWADGVSFGVIAKTLNARFKPIHRTRNACVGRAHRMGLRRETPTYRQSMPREKKTRAPSAPRLRKPAPRIVEPPPVLPPIGASDILNAASGTCRFICGDPRDTYQLCGHLGEPWCEAHRAIVYARGEAAPNGHVGQALRKLGRHVAMATTRAFVR